MDFEQLKILVRRGEDSGLQFKEDVRNADALSKEMVAFSNSNGGTILIGVEDIEGIKGLSAEEACAKTEGGVVAEFAGVGLGGR